MNKKLYILFLAAGMLLLGRLGLTEEENTGRRILALDEIVSEVLQQNPRISAARAEWEATQMRIPQARALPDPVLSYAHFGRSIETRLGPQRNKISLSQKIPFFGKRKLREQIADRHAAAAGARYSMAAADVVLAVKKKFYSLFWLEKAMDISEKEKKVLQRMEDSARARYEAGTAGLHDIVLAQLEKSRLEDQLLQWQQTRLSLVSELSAFLGRSDPFQYDEIEDFDLHLPEQGIDALIDAALQNRPDIQEANRIIEKNESGLSLARKNYFPDFIFMLDYIDIGSGSTSHPEDGRNSWMGSIGISIPLWKKKLRSAEAEARLRLDAAWDKRRDLENRTVSRVREIFSILAAEEDQVRLYRTSLIPQAEQALRAAEIGYMAGKKDFSSLLESERMLLKIRIGYFKLRSDMGKSLAHLERITGVRLETGNGKKIPLLSADDASALGRSMGE